MISDKGNIIKVAITGPESSGKSTIANKLAEHYHTVWVKEYAREYIDKLVRNYGQDDLVSITKGQIQNEDTGLSRANDILFCDTELTVIKIWSLHKYGSADPFIIAENKKRFYDIYLLMDVDLPWEYDLQRENPDKRKYFFDWFKKELEFKKANFHIINGNYTERFNKSKRIIDKYLKML